MPEAVSKSDPRGWKETVWFGTETNEKGEHEVYGTGSGCSSEPKPTWQTDPGCAGRMNDDVAVIGDQNTPVSTYDSYKTGSDWNLEGGTSVGAPIVAAAMALSSSYTRSFDGAHALYIDSLLNPGAFNDVTEGSNGVCTPPSSHAYFCAAKVGYDGPTGLGTLDGAPDAPEPILETEGAATSPAGEATLNATINPEDASFTKCRFEYGTTTSYGSSATVACPPETPESGTSPVSVSGHLTGLTAATKFHYRISATYQGQTSGGGDATFTTPGAPPSASTEAASAITTTTASLNAKVNPNGSQVTECRFEYGTSASYGSTVPCSASPGSGQGYVAVSAPVTLLAPATPYHFRIVAKNSFGEGEGTDNTFTTGAIHPEVAIEPASAITETAATLNATVNPLGIKITECRFEYGRSSAYEAVAPCSTLPGEGHGAVPVSAEIPELLPGRTYHFRIVAGNSEKATSASTDETFVTVAEPPLAITESALAAGSGSETLTGTVAPNGAAITDVPVRIRNLPGGNPRNLGAVLLAAGKPRSSRGRVGLGHWARRRNHLPLPARDLELGGNLLRRNAHLHHSGSHAAGRWPRRIAGRSCQARPGTAHAGEPQALGQLSRQPGDPRQMPGWIERLCREHQPTGGDGGGSKLQPSSRYETSRAGGRRHVQGQRWTSLHRPPAPVPHGQEAASPLTRTSRQRHDHPRRRQGGPHDRHDPLRLSVRRAASRARLPQSGAYAVMEMNDAVFEAALIEQFESRADVVRQGALAPTNHDRVQEEMTLVDQTGGDRLAGEIAAPNRDVGAQGELQLPDRVRVELALDPSVRAGWRLKSP